METSENTAENEQGKSVMQTRDEEVDIIKGATDTTHIEAMQQNAADSEQSPSPANIMEVNDGSQIDDPKDMEPINEFDQNEFYDHDHFEPNDFNEQNRSSEHLASQEISGTASMSERLEEEDEDKRENSDT
jgi:hypothetical protein